MSCPHCTKGKVKVDRRIMGVAIEVEVDCDVCKGTGLNQDPVPCNDTPPDFSNIDWGYTNVQGGECCYREDTWSDEAVKREIAQLKEYYAHPTVTWDWASGYYDWRKGAKAES